MISIAVNRIWAYVISLRASFRRCGSFFVRIFEDSQFSVHVWGKLRRYLLVRFRKEYVRRQMSIRQGSCRQCGACCSLLFTCPVLTKQRRCLVYGSIQPQACKAFPIDQRGIQEVNLCGGTCGYSFSPAGSQDTMPEG